jgi:hypothetical protein
MTINELAAGVRSTAGPNIAASVVGDGPGASQSQHAVAAALIMAVGLPAASLAPGSPTNVVARRLAALPVRALHAWLVQHIAELRAGQLSLSQLP